MGSRPSKVLMGTLRVDRPGVLIYLMDNHGMDARAIERLIWRSGLLGVSGISSDMRHCSSPRTRSCEATVRLSDRARNQLLRPSAGLMDWCLPAGLAARQPPGGCRRRLRLAGAEIDAAPMPIIVNGSAAPHLATDLGDSTDEERVMARIRSRPPGGCHQGKSGSRRTNGSRHSVNSAFQCQMRRF